MSNNLDRKTERGITVAAFLLVTFYFLCWLTFWGAVGYVILHFAAKVW